MKLILLLLLGVTVYGKEGTDTDPEYSHAGDPDFLEGDIQMSSGEGADRNMNLSKRWPMKDGFAYIPYVYEGDQTPGAKTMVAAAIKDYNRWTCVKFVPRTTEADYIAIINGVGCYSRPGNMGQGKQLLSLGDGCVSTKGKPEHEMMHAVGFFHEHTRADRDKYVEIVEENMIEGEGIPNQFIKCPDTICTDPKTPYDYESVMHYSPTGFAVSYDKPTIKALKPGGASMGQRVGLSEGDIKKIKELRVIENSPQYRAMCGKDERIAKECKRA